MNDQGRQALGRRLRSWNKYQEDRSEENYQAYQKFRNRATAAKRKAKKDFEFRLAQNIKRDKKHFYA